MVEGPCVSLHSYVCAHGTPGLLESDLEQETPAEWTLWTAFWTQSAACCPGSWVGWDGAECSNGLWDMISLHASTAVFMLGMDVGAIIISLYCLASLHSH